MTAEDGGSTASGGVGTKGDAMRPRFWPAMAVAFLTTIAICHGETVDGLKFDFSRKTVALEVTVEDLQDAYRVLADGSIKMLAKPAARTISERRAVVQVSRAKRNTGLLRITVDGRNTEVLVASDNRLAGPARTGGLPFGYAFLPPNGKATEGQTWEEEFPAPVDVDGPRVAATFRYTFAGAVPTEDCPECVEIRIVGLRRFLPDQSLAGMLASVFSGDDEYFVSDQLFAVGTVVFSPKQGFFRRFELAMNTSMLTPVSVPGMMRRIVVDAVEVTR